MAPISITSNDVSQGRCNAKTQMAQAATAPRTGSESHDNGFHQNFSNAGQFEYSPRSEPPAARISTNVAQLWAAAPHSQRFVAK